MARYVDGFVIPLKKTKLKAYLAMAKVGARIWKEHGALAYAECAADDLKSPCGVGFAKLASLRPGETLVFAFIAYHSRAHRDRVNARVMKDPRMNSAALQGPIPFDAKRMAMGGFKQLVGW
jgi:uncharacterized protein YbaA (DUF1428 family)